ncbi:MAG: hypothetical protein GWN67_22230 [Phycisphaerae bacterium]|nr:hypothetical protein [Phycisphaerae bacterium]NIP54797.1 hypothetical protein [Phycisphaerae bacterium]NIS50509.1 hypothetical protein [Phycisphaerae bacterium]NIU11114.1 hypothetical protein [Phycisphaerae bacterium]NIU59000.1 hypothetical protein [Phycisphaerae bacterium]
MLLQPEDASLFISLYSSLIGFTAGRLGGVAGIVDVKTFNRASNNARAEARDKLLDHISLIDDFVEENPYQFPERALSNVLKWEHFISDKFFVERDLKNYTVFLNEGDPPKAYGVLGLTDEIIEMIPYPLPVFGSAVLLPWKGQIVCDGLILIYSVRLGRGIRKNLKESYQQAKAQGIITSLETG